jgi:hypothetical protein
MRKGLRNGTHLALVICFLLGCSLANSLLTRHIVLRILSIHVLEQSRQELVMDMTHALEIIWVNVASLDGVFDLLLKFRVTATYVSAENIWHIAFSMGNTLAHRGHRFGPSQGCLRPQ